jgi:hypothetical protein
MCAGVRQDEHQVFLNVLGLLGLWLGEAWADGFCEV